jgi:phosphate transport system protein
MITRRSFDMELKELHKELIKMGSLVEESIENTIMALKKQDVRLAKRIFLNDDVIDDFEQKIERRCLHLIATQQPLAKDLRSIGAALKIITDMERIADHSADIAEITIRMAGEKYLKALIDIPLMADLAKDMVKRALDAYVRQDIELAREVCSDDDDVDNLFSKMKLELINIVKNEPDSIDQVINFLLIAKYLERMADHATNIGEWVVFNVTGEHEHLAKMLHKDDAKRNPFANIELE